jgi:hypothetical protein
MIRLVSLLIITVTLLLLTACITPLIVDPVADSTSRRYILGEFSKHGVHVAVAIAVNNGGTSVLSAEFSPTDPTLHLYSKDLPLGGIDGIGRPTLLAIRSGPLTAEGDLSANVADYEQKFLAIDKTFQLYPEGAVILSQEVKPKNSALAEELVIAVTYMACSSEGYCLPPVVDHLIITQIPNEFWREFSDGDEQ